MTYIMKLCLLQVAIIATSTIILQCFTKESDDNDDIGDYDDVEQYHHTVLIIKEHPCSNEDDHDENYGQYICLECEPGIKECKCQ
jgi:hypothetical protein